ncbi:MAG: sn-glycerol-3-phosphate ABC transporter ATP-binding protein UgpC [Candidatus Puniceispirillum sp.]|uniref:ABC transporter ATP-binding protein n=1 Tax=uncultured Candidatus Puniceispirillum sp. TaxID=1985115 RepID=UPI002A6C95A2|nr:sn-glycerol-3-phosphate ABC transporter ATP-binding protein UgpC [Candidatus Puniceispirillum sp.]MBT6565251.1 sn-glycerol-3-phosphate ABC transporter ATP-binding protein UgpC [Candidatus Puniceispirillum sp.]
MADLLLTNIHKSYDKTEVIANLNLTIKSGEFMVFVGPSGCGKSTLLRMIAGLEDISSGTLTINDEIVNDVVPAERGVAMVFQSYALYPHMTVFDNMAFGLRQSKTPKPEIERRVNGAASILQITDYLKRLPKHLSGGQRQRVAIGRAIVRDPKVFLFDEPLSNLDAALRVQTRIEIAKLHNDLDATMIYVTHDQVEAMTLADRIVVLNAGHIEQVGSPLELYNSPANKFVAGFIGSPKMNFIPTTHKALTSAPDNVTEIGIRPEHLIHTTKAKAKLNGRLRHIEQLGEYALAYIDLGNDVEITAKLEGESGLQHGADMYLTFDAKKVHHFDSNGVTLSTTMASA